MVELAAARNRLDARQAGVRAGLQLQFHPDDGARPNLPTGEQVGRIASLTFLAAVDDVKRFSSSRKLVGYSGLAPTVRQSGERTEYGAISREGRSELRAVWVQIAHLVARDKTKATQPLRTPADLQELADRLTSVQHRHGTAQLIVVN